MKDTLWMQLVGAFLLTAASVPFGISLVGLVLLRQRWRVVERRSVVA